VSLARLIVALVPSSATAGTVARDGSVIRWTGDPDADFVQAMIFPSIVMVTEDDITAGAGCSVPPDAGFAQCDSTGVTAVVLNAGAGDDTVSCGGSSGDQASSPCTVNGDAGLDSLEAVAWVAATLNGGADGDTLNGTLRANDVLNGGGGADTLSGDWGADRLDGGSGDDLLKPGDGTVEFGADIGDVVAGGDGFDTLSYFGMFGVRTITFDGMPDDGRPGEGDNVMPDVEGFRGGNDAETVIGSDSPNDFQGGGGADVLDGAGGNDTLRSSSPTS
jgi:Ca2+-binding RTX toxin-like protein